MIGPRSIERRLLGHELLELGPRAEPLPVAGVFARGSAARALAAKLRARLPLPGLAVARAGNMIVAFGDADALPWVERACWLGREPEAPGLLLPTRLALSPHPALVLAALERAGHATPIALLPDAETTGGLAFAISLEQARAPGADELDAFLRETAP